MALSQRIAFIGAGNMAGALVQGLIAARACSPGQLVASDARPEASAELARKHGIASAPDNPAAARGADVLVLCVKPQVLPAVLAELAPNVGPGTLAVSIAAGVPLSVLERGLGAGVRAVRAMPNTPALVQAGATAIAAGTHATEADLALCETLFASVGVVERVAEPLLDAVTGLSGSGPAYVFLLVEALSAAGRAVGLPAGTAAALAAQTVYGAAKLLHESGEAPEALRRKVTSPNGTTQAGIECLEQRDFLGVVADAVRSATERAHVLGAEAAAKHSS
jgi:pyrroline-5-carboxylate reductase